ncbi:hypothetical protein GF337_09200 [candidate division KSB1 bacterium]|nr:hypothetical protein [candidate division KSB1 bacterium]
MDNKNLGMLEAIQLAMEAELKAQKFYSNAVNQASNERGKDLLKQLANFEKKHYEALEKLSKSLKDDGQFIKYEGTTFDEIKGGVKSEVEGKLESNKDNVINILNMAIDAETKAFNRYKELAEETSDPDGRSMFQTLAEEESLHRRILSDEFYQLSNMGGVWSWGD